MRDFRVVVLLTLVAIILSVDAKIETINDQYSETQFVRLFSPFGAKAGATIQVQIKVEQESDNLIASDNWYYVVLLTDVQYSSTYSVGEICLLPSYMRYEFYRELNFTYELSNTDIFHLYLINCRYKSIYIDSKAVIINPGNNHISLDEQPLLYCYILLFACFIFAMSLSTLNGIIHWRFLRVIHLLLQTYVMLATIYLGMEVLFYSQYSSTGITSLTLMRLKSVVKVAAEGTLLGCLLLIAMGWSIVRSRLSTRNNQILWAAVLLFSGFNLAYSLCWYPENLCAVYMLFFHVIKFLITFAIVVAINSECEQLRLEFDPAHRDRIAIRKRLGMFHRLRWTFVVLLIIPISMIFFNYVVLSWQEGWITTVVNQVLYLMVFCEVSIVLRPRNRGRNIYFLNNEREPSQALPPSRNLPPPPLMERNDPFFSEPDVSSDDDLSGDDSDLDLLEED